MRRIVKFFRVHNFLLSAETYLKSFESQIFSVVENAITKTVESQVSEVKNSTEYQYHNAKGHDDKPLNAKAMCERYSRAKYIPRFSNCYIEVKKPGNLLEAFSNCTSRGFMLAYPKNTDELDFLRRRRSDNTSHYHIGIKKSYAGDQKIEYISYDHRILVPVNSEMWAGNEPNLDKKMEVCVRMNKENGKLEDTPPDVYPYFCSYS